MSIQCYVVPRDKFEPEEPRYGLGLAFPCNVCKHQYGSDKDEPCRTCDHNCNAEADMTPIEQAKEALLALAQEWRNDDGIDDEWARGRKGCADELESAIAALDTVPSVEDWRGSIESNIDEIGAWELHTGETMRDTAEWKEIKRLIAQEKK